MRHRPDGTYKWIGHYMDHWSKLHVLFSLSRKSAAEVAFNLKTQVFAYLGTPRILHSDNGREFVNDTISSLVKDWPGEVVISMEDRGTPSARGWLSKGMPWWRSCLEYDSPSTRGMITHLGLSGCPSFSVSV